MDAVLPEQPDPDPVGKFEPVTVNRWVARHGLLDDEDRPLPVRLDRIRTTFEARRDRRSWNGSTRATIDPNHSPRVEGDRYLTAATAAQRDAVEEIIADAQADMLRRAHPPAVLTDTETASLARDFPQLAAQLGLDDAALAELAGGQRDVFTAACADPLAGLHGPKGQPCPARPWVCLLCPLAIFTPRHAANLLRLKAFFARQWRQMPAAQFMAVFGPYAQRVEEISPGSPPRSWPKPPATSPIPTPRSRTCARRRPPHDQPCSKQPPRGHAHRIGVRRR